MLTLNLFSGTMPASKSHKRRAWTFLPDLRGEHLGTLTIEQSGRDLDSYAVELDTSERLGMARRFLLAKLDADGDVYAVTVGPRGVTCSGEWCGRCPTCKHRDAVLAALDAGAFDATEPAAA